MDNPFDRTNIGLRERPVSSDLNQLQSQLYRSITEMIRFAVSGRTSNSSSALASLSSFMGDGFRAVPSSPPAMSVQINAGLGFASDAVDVASSIGAPDLEGISDLSAFKPLPLITPVTFAVPAAPGSPNSRIDIIEVRSDRRLENGSTRRQLDTGTESFLDHVFFKTLAFCLDGRTGIVTTPAASTAGLSYKIGTAANPGVAPPTTSGYTKIAEINVPNGTTSITGANIVDRRKLMGMGGVVRAAIRFRTEWNGSDNDITVLSTIAPPGVNIGVLSLSIGQRATFLLHATAGDFVHVSRSLTLESPSPGGAAIGESIQNTLLGAGPIVNVDSLTQPGFIAAGVPAGIGQVAVLFTASNTLFRDGAGTGSVVSTKLNTVVFNVGLDFAYHQ